MIAEKDAEQAVLGAILLDNTAYWKIAGALTAVDFGYPKHAVIFATMTRLMAKGERVDYLTLTDAGLTDAGGLVDIGQSVTTAQGIVHHAALVKKSALRRALAGVGVELTALAEDATQDAHSCLVRAVQRLSACLSTKSTATALKDVLADTLALIERIGSANSRLIGIPTGWTQLDYLTGGWQPGQNIVLAGRTGMGKAQPLTANILTPTGWRLMGDLKCGDAVIGANGLPAKILAVHERGKLDTFTVSMSDGTSTECCGDHLWLTRTHNERRRTRDNQAKVRTTKEIQATITNNHSIPFTQPVQFTQQSKCLPVEPYLLGIYLGDGDSGTRICNPELDIQKRIASSISITDMIGKVRNGITFTIKRARRNNTKSDFAQSLQALGLATAHSWDKFIPEQYLYASIENRIKLLQGLCDADGYVTVGGKSVEYTTTSIVLRDGIVFLVGSLGGYVTWMKKETHYLKDGVRYPCRIAYRMILAFPSNNIVPVLSEKHRKRWKNEKHRLHVRYIKDVKPSGKKICRCITVENSDGLYVTDGFIVTHNSACALHLALTAARAGHPCAILTLEMSRTQLALRFLSKETDLPYGVLRRGLQVNAGAWPTLTRAANSLALAPIYLAEMDQVTMLDIVQLARQLVIQHGIQLLVIDNMNLVAGAHEYKSMSENSRLVKLGAKELNIPVVALYQLKREVDQKPDPHPVLSDLKQSGSIENDADIVLLLFRKGYYEDTGETSQDAELELAKHRDGPTGVITCQWHPDTMSFTE